MLSVPPLFYSTESSFATYEVAEANAKEIDEVAEANAKETDDDHEQDTFYRRP